MNPSETARHYDEVAHLWQQNTPETYGISQLERAIRFLNGEPNGKSALDVGCGSQGRFIKLLDGRGFATSGIDISPRMISLVRARFPETAFYCDDICEWSAPGTFDFISAWDSTFHLPIFKQEPVLRKLCRMLNPTGVLLFTCGGGPPGEIQGSFYGQDFEYSTLGVEHFVAILRDEGLFCRHVEYDQYPENHVSIIAQSA